MEANATTTLFTNNLEIDENVEVETNSDPTTFVLNIKKNVYNNLIFQQIQVLVHLYSTLQKINKIQQPNIFVASISKFSPSATKLQQ